MFDFEVRINRLTYLIKSILGIVFLAAGIVALYFIDTSVDTQLSDTVTTVLLWVFILGWFLYDICILKQRCNDVSADNALLLTVLFFVTSLYFVLFFIPGEKKANKYGAAPKGIKLGSK